MKINREKEIGKETVTAKDRERNREKEKCSRGREKERESSRMEEIGRKGKVV